mgnify:CR=1 FL=1
MQNGGGHFGQLRGPDHGGSDCWRCGGAMPAGGRIDGGDTSRGSPLREVEKPAAASCSLGLRWRPRRPIWIDTEVELRSSLEAEV